MYLKKIIYNLLVSYEFEEFNGDINFVVFLNEKVIGSVMSQRWGPILMDNSVLFCVFQVELFVKLVLDLVLCEKLCMLVSLGDLGKKNNN